MANLAAIATLADRGEVVLLDRLNHASLIDGTLLSGARFSRYAHGDAARRRARAQGASGRCNRWSRPTACSAWMAMSRACRRSRASRARTRPGSIVDDAHGLGVLGPTGRGMIEHFELGQADVPVLVGTLGKAFGTLRRLRRRLGGPHRVADAEGAHVHLHDGASAARRRRHAQVAANRAARILATRARARAYRSLSRRRPGSWICISRRRTRRSSRSFSARADAAVSAQNELLEAGFLGRRDPAADRAGRHGAPANHAVRGAHRSPGGRARRSAGPRASACAERSEAHG